MSTKLFVLLTALAVVSGCAKDVHPGSSAAVSKAAASRFKIPPVSVKTNVPTADVADAIPSLGKDQAVRSASKCATLPAPKGLLKLKDFDALVKGTQDYQLAAVRVRQSAVSDAMGDQTMTAWAKVAEKGGDYVVEQGVDCIHEEGGETLEPNTNTDKKDANMDLTAALKFVGANWVQPETIAFHWGVDKDNRVGMTHSRKVDGTSLLDELKKMDKLPEGLTVDVYANKDKSRFVILTTFTQKTEGTVNRSHENKVDGEVVDSGSSTEKVPVTYGIEALLVYKKI